MHAILAGDFARSERLQVEARALDHDQPRARRAIAFHRICFLRAAERHVELRAALPELRGLWLQMPFGTHLADARVAAALARLGAEDELRALLAHVPDEAYDEEISCAALAEALWLTGDATHARRLQAHLRVDRWPMYWFDVEIVEGPSARYAAYLAALTGDWTSCEQYSARALRDLEAAGWRSLAARMRFELGDLMLRKGREPARATELVAAGRAEAATLQLEELVALIDRRHPRADATAAFTMSLEGEYYAITSPRGLLRFKTSRGMQYLARLVASPGVEIHVLDLVGSAEADRGDAGEVLDPTAIRAYRARLEALRDAAEDAEAIGDVDRAERAREEMEAIAAELARGTGPAGRVRRGESAVDRARSAVQRRIKDALDRITATDPQLGERLRRAVRTGNHCSFREGA
jgi:hypothetical protein